MLQTSRQYHSMVAFYRAAYADTLVDVSGSVSPVVTCIHARHGAGDYSVAEVPEIVIARGLSREICATLDLGAGQFRTVLSRNAMVITPPDTRTKVLLDHPNEVEFLAIPYAALRSLCQDHALPQDGDFGAAHRMRVECPRLRSAVLHTAREVRAGNPNGPLYVEEALLQIAALLLAGSQRRLSLPTGGLAAWQLARVTDHLQDRVAAPVSLSELAGLAGLSVFHFARAFKESMGIAPHQCHVSMRMERARLLLSRSSEPITEIALTLGYDSSQSFSRAFRIAHGTSPSLYRAATRGQQVT